MLTLGVGVFPIASAGATYKYGTGNFQDSTELFFLETTPAIAFNPSPNLRFGLGYRITYVHLSRYQGDPDSGSVPVIDFKMSGQNFTGFRVGVQWSALPWLEFGAVFRNTVNTKVTNSHGIALQVEYTDISTHFKLPAKLGFGSARRLRSLPRARLAGCRFRIRVQQPKQGRSARGHACARLRRRRAR